jgi:ribosomal protein S12 methylthiotransferase accessory factor
LAREKAPVAFRDVPSLMTDDLGEDLRWALRRLAAVGAERVIAVDLTRPEFGIPVVRLVVPGLEWDPHHPTYRPGRRAQASARQ